jgi:hypothetical protein
VRPDVAGTYENRVKDALSVRERKHRSSVLIVYFQKNRLSKDAAYGVPVFSQQTLAEGRCDIYSLKLG